MRQRFNLLDIAKDLDFSNECDQPMWMYNPSGVYSVKYFYAIVNNTGIKQIHIPAIWNITIPRRIHVFFGYIAKKSY
jgi:hypothetical protein